MRNSTGVWQAMLFVTVAAGLAYLPLAGRGGTPAGDEEGTRESRVAGPTGPARAPARDVGTLTGGAGVRTDEVRDAVSLLADFFNLDVSPATVRRAIGGAVNLLADEAAASARPPEARDVAPAAGPATEAQGADAVAAEGASAGAALEESRARQEALELLRGLSAAAPGGFPRDVGRAFETLVSCADAPGPEPGCPVRARRAAERVHGFLEGASVAAELPTASAPRAPILDTMALALVHAAAVTGGFTVQFLLATLADPCDSYTGAAFDPTLESIRRAVESGGFVLDRFAFPDWNPAAAAGRPGPQCSGTLHERNPGVVVFRRENVPGVDGVETARSPGDPGPADRVVAPNAPRTPDRTLLVLFSVPETPTLGILPVAFVRAVRFITGWRRAGAGGEPTCAEQDVAPIRIVGPSFSGSSSSLARTIRNLPAGFATGFRFDVISGSATSASNLDVLGNTPAGPGHCGITFSAATLPDPTLTAVMDRFLARIGIEDRDKALLVESNTAYGSALRATRQADRAGASAPSCGADVTTDRATAAPPPLEVPFPLHISRIRTSRAPPSPLSIGSRLQPPDARPLELEEPQPPSDLLPPLRPELTTPTVELVLRDLLQTVRQEQRRAVGIFATDVRDKLFLAREVRRRAPDATLFTSEADILYTHPSFAAYTRGMLVVSSYPMYNRTQLWTAGASGARGRMQFSSMAAQGTYNATVLQLRGLASEAHADVAVGDPLPLADYAMPFDAGSRAPAGPPAWITVVGRTRTWPVAVEPVADPRAAAYTARAVPGGLGAPAFVAFAPSPTSVFAFWLLAIVAAAHVSAYAAPGGVFGRASYFRRFRSRDPLASPSLHALRGAGEMHREEALERARALLACFVALTLFYGYAAALAAVWFVHGPGGWWRAALIAVGVVIALVLVATTLTAAVRTLGALPRLGATRERSPALQAARVVHRGGVTVLATLAAGCCAAYVIGVFPRHVWTATPRPDELWRVFLFERATSLTSGVSPVWTILAFTLAAYSWGTTRLRRMGPARDVRMTDRLVVLATLTAPDRPRTRVGVPFPFVAAAVIVGVLTACLLFLLPNWPTTVEGRAFDAMVFWMVILLQVLIATAIARLIYYRRVIQHHLERFAGQPIVEAYRRLPREMVAPAIFIRPPRLSDADPLVRRLAALPARFRQLVEASGTLPALHATVADGPADTGPLAPSSVAAHVPVVYAEERAATPGLGWSDSRSRVFARVATLHLLDRMQFARRLLSAVEEGRAGDAERGWAAECRAWIASAEEAVAIQLLLGLREAFARLAGTAVFIMVASFLLLAGHTLLPVQPRQTLLGMTWANIGVAIVVGLSGLAAVDRNGVLSDITRTERGAVNWNWTLIRRVVLYAILPLASMLTVQFPEIGATLMEWIEPVQRALL